MINVRMEFAGGNRDPLVCVMPESPHPNDVLELESGPVMVQGRRWRQTPGETWICVLRVVPWNV